MKYWRVYWLALDYSLHSCQTCIHELFFFIIFFFLNLLKTVMTSRLARNSTRGDTLRKEPDCQLPYITAAAHRLNIWLKTHPDSSQERDGGVVMIPEPSVGWIASPPVLLGTLRIKRPKLRRYTLYLPAKTTQEQESTCIIHRSS